MSLSSEQATQIKEQLIKHIEATFPEEKRQVAISQINSMDDEQLEEFLKKNKMIKEDGSENEEENADGTERKEETPEQQCIFCQIANEKVPAYKVDENEEAIAVLEINPISKGHIIVIPKKHESSEENIPKEAFTLANAVAKTLKSKLKPKDVKIETSKLFNHAIINVFPVNENEHINSKRTKAEESDLVKHHALLIKKPKTPRVKKPKTEKINEKKMWLPKRIP